MKKFLLFAALLSILSTPFAGFELRQLDVTIIVNDDGSAKVTERMQMLVTESYSISLYNSGLSKNDLASWSTITELPNLRTHLSRQNVDIRNFRLRPQPLKQCNSLLDMCHGEILLEYDAYPYYEKNDSVTVRLPATGVFNVDYYKPRTIRYILNPKIFTFETTEGGDSILKKEETLRIILPENSMVYEVNPFPDGTAIRLPQKMNELSWNNVVLTQFTLIFEREEGVDMEITNFFNSIRDNITTIIFGKDGMAVVFIIVVLFGSYLYLKNVKRR